MAYFVLIKRPDTVIDIIMVRVNHVDIPSAVMPHHEGSFRNQTILMNHYPVLRATNNGKKYDK